MSTIKLLDWMREQPSAALRALRALWTTNGQPLAERIESFCGEFPTDVIGGAGTRANVVSVLLMGEDVERYPPYRIRFIKRACAQTGCQPPREAANEAELYEHALGFLDRFIEEAEARDLPVGHRLEAQSIVWGTLSYSGSGGHLPGAARYGEDVCCGQAGATSCRKGGPLPDRPVPSVLLLRGLRAGLPSDAARRPATGIRDQGRAVPADRQAGEGRPGREVLSGHRRD